MVKKVGLLYLVISVMAVGAYGGGLALSGVSSKALGMGGAFRGLADNWSAAYWNPAGLAQLSMSEINVGYIALTPRPEFNPRITVGGYDIGYKNSAVRYPDDKTGFAPNVSGFFKLPFREDITFGVALYVPYSLSSEWDLFDPIYKDIIQPYPDIDHELTLEVIDIHPSLAKSFMDGRLMFGIGVSIMKGEINYRRVLLRATPIPRPHDNVAIDAILGGEGWGYGANFGFLYKLSDKLKLGVSGKTPTTLKIEGDAKFNLFTIDHPELWVTFMDEATSSEDSAMINYIFSQLDTRFWKKNTTVDLKLPSDIGIGIAYEASEKLTLTLDFSYTFWSRLDSIVFDLSEVTEGVPPPVSAPVDAMMVIRTKWDDIFRLSLGGQYRYLDPFALRFGFYYEPSPIPDDTFSPLIPDVGAKYSANIGAAFHVSSWELAYSFEYVRFASRDVVLDTNSGIDFDNYPGSYKSYYITNNLSLTFRF